MSLSDDLEQLKSAGPSEHYARVMRGNYPKGWEPRIEYDPAEGGEFISSARVADDTNPDETALFAEFELDSDRWVVLNMRRSRWQRHDGEWLEAFRCTFAPRARAMSDADLDTIIDEIRKAKPSGSSRPTGEISFLALSGDQQIGKPDGDGTRGTVERIISKTDLAVERLQMHRANGLPIGNVYLPQLGDCIEGYNSQGGKHLWRNELTLTQMIRVYRRLLMYQVKAFAPHAERIVVPIIPGNHDEAVRVGNSMATTYTDSWAIEAASAVQDALAENPDAYGHVHFVFPEEDELTVTLDISGTVCGFAHGHQFGRDPLKWWAGQAHGREPIGDATILFGAHLHHFHAQYTGGGKTFFRVPSLDGGSTWFRHRTGEAAPPGLVTMTMDEAGWNNLVIV
jgi:hypothetical protein